MKCIDISVMLCPKCMSFTVSHHTIHTHLYVELEESGSKGKWNPPQNGSRGEGPPQTNTQTNSCVCHTLTHLHHIWLRSSRGGALNSMQKMKEVEPVPGVIGQGYGVFWNPVRNKSLYLWVLLWFLTMMHTYIPWWHMKWSRLVSTLLKLSS